MTVSLNIEPAVQETLAAKAHAMGVPLETLIKDILEREANLSQSGSGKNSGGSQDREERDHLFQLALAWLAENRHRYVGRWIALQGPKLLATGENAKEVYAKIAGQPIPPLVVRVEEEDPPFAGW